MTYQRYYASNTGRFLTPDPYQASGGPADPQSWNRYAYVLGDPANLSDPDGRDAIRLDIFGLPPVIAPNRTLRNGEPNPNYVPGAELFINSWLRAYPVPLEQGGFSPRDYYEHRSICKAAPAGRFASVSLEGGLFSGVGATLSVVLNYETQQATLTLSLGMAAGAIGGGNASAQAGFIFGPGDAAARYVPGGNTTVNVGQTVAGSVATSGGMSTTSPITVQSPLDPESYLAIGVGAGISLTVAYASLTSDNTVKSWSLGSFATGPAALLVTPLDAALVGVRNLCR